MALNPIQRTEALSEIEMGLYPCDPVQALKLDLAAAQLAITLGLDDTANVNRGNLNGQGYDSPYLDDRIHHHGKDEFDLEDILSWKERNLLRTARVIVGLTFRAARNAAVEEARLAPPLARSHVIG